MMERRDWPPALVIGTVGGALDLVRPWALTACLAGGAGTSLLPKVQLCKSEGRLGGLIAIAAGKELSTPAGQATKDTLKMMTVQPRCHHLSVH